mgnify:CR=1 FL=1
MQTKNENGNPKQQETQNEMQQQMKCKQNENGNPKQQQTWNDSNNNTKMGIQKTKKLKMKCKQNKNGIQTNKILKIKCNKKNENGNPTKQKA